MKKLLAGALAIFALAIVSCDTVDEFVPPYVPSVDGGELPALNVPKSLSIAVNEGRWVVLAWTGDETATRYEVEVSPQGGETRTLPTESTSVGFYDLADVTNHTWRVRAKRGEEFSEWVVGTAFTTKTFTDPRTDYIGSWRLNGEAWDLGANFSTSGMLGQSSDIDLSQLEEMLPIDILNELIGVATFTLEEGTIVDPTYSQLMIGLSALEEFVELPYSYTAMQLNTFNGRLAMAQNLDQTIPYPGPLPIPVSDIPFLSDMIGGGSIPNLNLENLDMDITKLSMRLSRLNLELGPLNREATPYTMAFVGSIHVDIFIETNVAFANPLIDAARPQISLTFTSSVSKQ